MKSFAIRHSPQVSYVKILFINKYIPTFYQKYTSFLLEVKLYLHDVIFMLSYQLHLEDAI